MGLEVLMTYGRNLVQEQDNVKRVQLADAYLGGAELAGSDGSSVPEEYEGAKGLNLEGVGSTRGSWRQTPAAEPARESYSPPTPSYEAPAAREAAPSADRWSRAAAPTPAPAAAPQRSAGGSSAGGRTLSASDLAVFKIADLAEIARKRGVSGGRDATRQSLTDALVKAGVSTSGMLVDLSNKLGVSLGRDVSTPCARAWQALSASLAAVAAVTAAPAAPAAGGVHPQLSPQHQQAVTVGPATPAALEAAAQVDPVPAAAASCPRAS